MSKRPLVAVVDDSEAVRESLPDLLQQVGFAVQAFASAEAFLASEAVDETSCLILDVGLPGMSGPELQQELTTPRESRPNRLHHRARRQVAASAPASPPGRWRACSNHSATPRCSKRSKPRLGRGDHDDHVSSEHVIRRPYTVSPSTAARGLEVVPMADVKGHRVRRRRRHLGARIAGAAGQARRLAAAHCSNPRSNFSPALVPPFRAAWCSM